MEKPWKVVFAFVAVFIAGAVFGGLFTLRASGGRRPPGFAMFDRNGGGPRGSDQGRWQGQKQGPGSFAGQGQNQAGMLFGRLDQRLKLTDDQREKIRPVVAKAVDEMQRLGRENLQNTTRIAERMHLDISAFLTPEQRGTLEDMKTQMHERVRRAGMDMRGDGPQRRPGPGQGRANQPDAAPASSTTATPPAAPASP
jgi:hypothetical protein